VQGTYEDLKVWRRAMDLVLEVLPLYEFISKARDLWPNQSDETGRSFGSE
jgi:hypothetical protein